MDPLPTQYQRSLAVALLLASLCAAWFLVIAPIARYAIEWIDIRHAELKTLSRDRSVVAQDARIRTALDSAAQSPRWARMYDSQKPEQAVQQLETDLRAVITAPNNPTSMTVQPPKAQGLLTRIAVKVTLSMPIDQWAETLSRLQSQVKFLQIDNLTIQAPDNQIIDTNPGLTIQAEIAAFMVTPKGPRT